MRCEEVLRRKRKRNELLRAMLIFALLLFLFFPDVIVGSRSLNPAPLCPGVLPRGPYQYKSENIKHPVLDAGESAWFNGPWNALSKKLIREGEPPLWNPHAGCGTPLLANMISAPFYPLKILLYLLPTEEAWELYALLRLFIAALFTYLFLRLFDLGFLPALLGGTIFAFSGYSMLYINMMQMNIDILIPVLLFFLERLIRTGRVKDLFFTALVVWFSILGGMPQSTFFVFFFGTIYAIVRLIQYARTSGEARVFIHRGIRCGAAFFLGIALSFPLLLPFWEYWREAYTQHVAGRGLTFYPTLYGVMLLAPHFYEAIAAPNIYAVPFTYLGVVAFLLAVASLFSRQRPRGVFVFFAIYALIVVLKTFGFPLVNWIGALPLFNVSSFDEYNTPIFMFLMGALAARGCQSLFPGEKGLTRALSGAGVVVGILALYRILWALGIFKAGNIAWLIPGKPLPIIAKLPLLFLCLGLIPFLLRRISHRFGLLAAFVCFLAVVIELYTYCPKARPLRCDPYRPPPFAAFLRESAGEGRPRVLGINRILVPNTATPLGLDDIKAKGPLWVKRYEQLIRKYFCPGLIDGFHAWDKETYYLPPRLLNLLGVRYIVGKDYFHEVLPFHSVLFQKGTVFLKDGKRAASSFAKEEAIQHIPVGLEIREVLFSPPPITIEVPLQLPEGGLELRTFLGIATSTWNSCGKEGIVFAVNGIFEDTETRLFERRMQPMSNPKDREWKEVRIDLSRYAGKAVNLRFSVTGGTEAVRCGWKMPKIVATTGGPYPLVYNQEVMIFENEKALPRAYLVFQGRVIENADQLLDQVGSATFSPEREALLEKKIEWDGLKEKADVKGRGRVAVTQYEPHRVTLKASLDRKGLLVLTDVFFPGWEATVDGEQREILRTNYAFRSVLLDAGEHEVVFTYAPSSFRWGVILMGICGAVFLALGIVLRRGAPSQ